MTEIYNWPKLKLSGKSVFPNLPFWLFAEAEVLHADAFPTFWLDPPDSEMSVFCSNSPTFSWFSHLHSVECMVFCSEHFLIFHVFLTTEQEAQACIAVNSVLSSINTAFSSWVWLKQNSELFPTRILHLANIGNRCHYHMRMYLQKCCCFPRESSWLCSLKKLNGMLWGREECSSFRRGRGPSFCYWIKPAKGRNPEGFEVKSTFTLKVSWGKYNPLVNSLISIKKWVLCCWMCLGNSSSPNHWQAKGAWGDPWAPRLQLIGWFQSKVLLSSIEVQLRSGRYLCLLPLRGKSRCSLVVLSAVL